MSKSIDYEQLKKLDELFEEDVIDEEEYKEKAVKIICGNDYSLTSPQTSSQSSSGGKTILIMLVCALAILAGALGMYAYDLNDQINNLAGVTKKEYDDAVNEKYRYLDYKNTLESFYLDNAVLVLEGGGAYHRYKCPTFPDKYTYWIYNVESAIDRGYYECPECFGMSKGEYCRKYIEY